MTRLQSAAKTDPPDENAGRCKEIHKRRSGHARRPRIKIVIESHNEHALLNLLAALGHRIDTDLSQHQQNVARDLPEPELD